MSRLWFNMNHRAWNNIQRNWKVSTGANIFMRKNISGVIFSIFEKIQLKVCRSRRLHNKADVKVFIVGYWRSGTTLLHEYMALDSQYGFPTTYACMNPHHFVLTQAAALGSHGKQAQRPMDHMSIQSASPQEDEFALLCMGARSPYEALLVPRHLSDALSLADPEDLAPGERGVWHEKFAEFLEGVSLTCGGRPLILKSPTHSYRIATLRRLFPDARFILIVRNPYDVFDSAVGMWRELAGLYALGALPTDEEIREAVLKDRPRFEAKLEAGLAGLPANRFQLVRYEDLVFDPTQVLREIYERLDLGDYSSIADKVAREFDARAVYKPRVHNLDLKLRSIIELKWRSVFGKYNYKS